MTGGPPLRLHRKADLKAIRKPNYSDVRAFSRPFFNRLPLLSFIPAQNGCTSFIT